jgi:hypothetical protein
MKKICFPYRLFLSSFFTVAVGAVALTAPSAAHAGVTVLSCLGSDSITFKPGITNSPQVVDYSSNATFGPCVGTLGQPLITGGTSTVSNVPFQYSCLYLLETGIPPYTMAYKWSDGSQSVVKFTDTNVTLTITGDMQVELVGTVQSGTGQGSAAVVTVTLASTDLTGCDTPEGVPSMGGVLTLNFVR